MAVVVLVDVVVNAEEDVGEDDAGTVEEVMDEV